MYKRLLRTAAAFLTFIIITAGGLYVFRLGLENREKSMLSEKGTVEQKSKSRDNGSGLDGTSASYVETDTSLSEEELYQILKNDEDAVAYQPHEPYYGQLTMQQAVEKGSEWLDQFGEQNSALDFSQELGKRVWANLIRAGEEELSVVDSNRIFSRWNLNFYEPGTTVNMEINAVTGEVLAVNIYKETAGITKEDKKRMLEIFVSQFDLSADGEIREEEGCMVQSLCEGRFYAVEEDIYTEPYDDTGIGCSFKIKITTQNPLD